MSKSRAFAILARVFLAFLIGGGIRWIFQKEPEPQVVIGQEMDRNEKLLACLRDLPGALEKADHSSLQNDFPARFERACATLEQSYKLVPGSLTSELSLLGRSLLDIPETPGLDRALALLVSTKFSDAESQALIAGKISYDGSGPAPKQAISALELAGSAAMEQAQHARALEFFRKAALMTGREQNPAAWARVSSMVAYALRHLGDEEQAWLLSGEIYRVRVGALGVDHEDTLSSRLHLADALFLRGRFAEAEREYGTVLGVRMRTYNPDHPDCLIPRMYMANALNAQRNYGEAEREFRQILKIQERVQGYEHPESLRNRNNLAIALSGLGRRAEAEREYRVTLQLREKVLGSDHRDTLKSRMNLALVLDEQGKHEAAESEFRRVLTIQERILGPEQPEVFLTCYNFSVCLLLQGKKDEALELARRASTGWNKVLGEAHPKSKAAKRRVEELERE